MLIDQLQREDLTLARPAGLTIAASGATPAATLIRRQDN